MTVTPVLIDMTAPQNPNAVINHGGFMTNSPEVIVTISANDVDTGVSAYYISESPNGADAAPSRDGWKWNR